MKKLLTFLFAMFFAVPVFAACSSNQIDVTGDGSNCQTAHFSVGTTSTNTFKFTMSAKGTFYVDCGNGGTLTSDASDVTNNTTITRSGTTVSTYTCTWGTAGTQTIRFGGTATGYSTGTSTAAIAFYVSSGGTQANIASISGNLSAMFPYISGNAATGAQPRFYQTFYNATGLTSIPDTLFANYTMGASYMFISTFYGCTGLTSIPANLFFPKATSVTGQTYMFGGTFSDCSGLTSIPENLFAKVTSGAGNMFSATFRRTSITSIPANLFFPKATSVTGQTYMFGNTFYDCKGLTSIPANLFAKVTSGADQLFWQTFYGCTGLTSLPGNLFFPKGYAGGKTQLFAYTFYGCTGLTSISANLFANVTSGASNLFQGTFSGCTGLTSIPENLFSRIATGTQGLFNETFSGCTGLTSIPANLFANIRTVENYQGFVFFKTFKGCTGLTSIPENLFANLTSLGISSTGYTFGSTFEGCTNITGYIPKSTFAGLIANGSPTASNMWRNTFTNTKLVSSCPSGTTTINTTYKGTDTSTYQKWGNYAMCEAVTGLDCSAGYYLPANANACAICPINNVCSGGTYTPGANNQGITACTSGTFAPTGSTVCYPHIFHVGDDKIYMNSTKQTTPSLNFRIGNDVFFINMTTTRTKMNKDSDHYFHVQWGNNDYYMCDNTTCPQ